MRGRARHIDRVLIFNNKKKMYKENAQRRAENNNINALYDTRYIFLLLFIVILFYNLI